MQREIYEKLTAEQVARNGAELERLQRRLDTLEKRTLRANESLRSQYSSLLKWSRRLEWIIVTKDDANTTLLSQIEISNNAQQGLLDTLVEKEIQHLEEKKLLQVTVHFFLLFSFIQ